LWLFVSPYQPPKQNKTFQIRVLRCGLPIAREKPEHFADFWAELGSLLEGFLFPDSSEDQKQEDRMADEAVDCHIIELLREEVLPFPKEVRYKNYKTFDRSYKTFQK